MGGWDWLGLGNVHGASGESLVPAGCHRVQGLGSGLGTARGAIYTPTSLGETHPYVYDQCNYACGPFIPDVCC